jgi:aconitate hydratase
VPARTYAQVGGNFASQKVTMSNLEQDKFINYQRIEDNLQIVRKR